MAERICGILLAAGTATRFGADKLLHRLEDGMPIALAALNNLRQAIPQVVAVVRPQATALEDLLRGAGATVISCLNADEGMGASLAAAVRASQDASASVVALADMPYIRPQTIAAIASALDAGAAIAAPGYRRQRGHPVGFSAQFRAQLLALHGDAGARALLQQHRALLQVIAVDDPGVCLDIDTPLDLRKA